MHPYNTCVLSVHLFTVQLFIYTLFSYLSTHYSAIHLHIIQLFIYSLSRVGRNGIELLPTLVSATGTQS